MMTGPGPQGMWELERGEKGQELRVWTVRNWATIEGHWVLLMAPAYCPYLRTHNRGSPNHKD